MKFHELKNFELFKKNHYDHRIYVKLHNLQSYYAWAIDMHAAMYWNCFHVTPDSPELYYHFFFARFEPHSQIIGQGFNLKLLRKLEIGSLQRFLLYYKREGITTIQSVWR